MTRNPAQYLIIFLTGLFLNATAPITRATEPLVFVSAFAAGDQGAIYAYQLDLKSGGLKLLERTANVENPFFMALSPDRKFLYSIDAKQPGGKEPDKIAAFEIVGRAGQLKLLNRQTVQGSETCYLSVDATGRTLLFANYTSGTVGSVQVRADGSLAQAVSFIQHAGSSIDPERQEGPHAHSFILSPDNRFAYAADLGLDRIMCYRLDAATAKLTPNRQPFVRTPPGAGPRHITFHPKGKRLYAINELSNTITLFDQEPETGLLVERQTISTLPQGFIEKSYCADVKITPDGRFMYGTNRGHDSIAVFRIDEEGRPTLTAIEPSLGKGPQNLAITSDGGRLLCANMPGNNVAVFQIDPQTGRLKSAGPPVAMTSPSCIMLVP